MNVHPFAATGLSPEHKETFEGGLAVCGRFVDVRGECWRVVIF